MSKNKYYSVCIIDDHDVVRQGLNQILDDTAHFTVTNELSSAEDALAYFNEDPEIDIILLDISLPGRSGLELLQDLRYIDKEVKILVVSMHPEEEFAVRCIKAGATGYLNKKEVTNKLTEALKTILNGKYYLNPSLMDNLVEEIKDENQDQLHNKLTDREYQVMLLLAQGYEVKEIASKLSVSSKTIGTYRTRLLKKMDMKNLVELTHYSIQNNLIEI